ncbi:WD repeat-containing and planar cell polarity effector protein fritz isoform X2 [Eupeodes corollae]|uniref:WD repeat-containing and planar cell polarity effector protein fritz isoform X2 n=1 Tax=Eupeodes corollae TaxID=290404 RepID=UPI0024935284|nr:WD repeat-containing and planar cell polarity effector protein fritz isoform X2 [Eupeodes corollae]
MLTLLSECHFWTNRDEIHIKDTDYGAFKYLRSRDIDPENVLQLAKREYAENRDCQVVLKNHKTSRLKDNIKKLDEFLHTQKIIHSEWRTGSVLLMLFANGVICHISVDIYVGDILCLAFDKYLIGKLAADVITDAIFTPQHIVLAYNTNQVTVVHLQKPNMQPAVPEKIVNMDPKIFHVLIPGTAERKLSRRLAVNPSCDLIAIWTKSSQNEVFPWRPTVRDQDRANIHVFKLKNSQLEAISYAWSENDPLRVDFLRSTGNQIFIIEEKVSRKGEVSAEVCSYELGEGKMQRAIITSIPMGTQICSFEFSPDQEKLFLGTIDRYVCIHDLVKQTSRFLPKIEIIPTKCTWHADSSLIMVGNDTAQFQCFDVALQPIANQLISEVVTPVNLLDLSHYFAIQPMLLDMNFSRKPEVHNFPFPFAQADCFLLLVFDNGPVACLRFVCGAGMAGDIHNSGLTADVILDRYVSMNHLEKAVNLLQALNWETYGAMCLLSLHKIANFVFIQKDLKRNRLECLTNALKTFTDGLSEETKDEFSDQVYDIKRRFFFFLLRNNLYAESFEVAMDIEDYDLFMDLFHATRTIPELIELSHEAYAQAEILFDESCSGSSDLDSSCSESSSYSDNYQNNQKPGPTVSSHRVMGQWKHEKAVSTLKNYVPPLPSFKSKIYNAENIKINIPKPELRISTSADFNSPSRTATLARTKKVSTSQQLELRQDDQLLTSRNSDYGYHVEPNRWASSLAKPELTMVNPDVPCTSKAANLLRNSQVSQISQENNTDYRNESPQEYLIEETYMPRPNLSNFGRISQNIAPPLPDLRHLQISSPSSHDINTSSTQWNQVPDQTLGIPMIPNAPTHPYMPSTSHNILPRASTHLTGNDASIPAPAAVASGVSSPRIPDHNVFQPKFYQHPLVSVTIPPTTMFTPIDELPARLPIRKPTASILSNGSSLVSNNTLGSNVNPVNGTMTTKKDPGEKNKVKFSDTVQVAVVPEIPRKEKPLPPKRNGHTRPRNLTNPKKELADSLPLCHPHDDYLKDFDPLPESLPRMSKSSSSSGKDSKSQSNESKSNPSIKVVHFGVV